MSLITYLFHRKIKKIAEAVSGRVVCGKHVCVVGTVDNDAIVCVLDNIQQPVNLQDRTGQPAINGALIFGVRFLQKTETNAQEIVQLLKELKEIRDRHTSFI